LKLCSTWRLPTELTWTLLGIMAIATTFVVPNVDRTSSDGTF
jgi:hypothetical protein